MENEIPSMEPETSMNVIGGVKKNVVIAVVVILLAAVGWYAYSSYGVVSKKITIRSVLESMSEVKSESFEGSVNIHVDPTKANKYESGGDFEILFKGASDVSDKDNEKAWFDFDIKGEASNESVNVGIELRVIKEIVYVRFKELKVPGFPLPFSVNKWVSISDKDIEEVNSLMGNSKPLATPKIDEVAMQKIFEKYSPRFSTIAEKHDFVSVVSSKLGQKIDGQKTREIVFTLEEQATIDFGKEAMPVVAEFLREAIQEIPQYRDMLKPEDIKFTKEDEEEFEKGLREFFKVTKSVFTVVVGESNSLLYGVEMNMEINDTKKGESGTIIAKLSQKDFGKPVSVEIPSETISFQEFFQSLMGGQMRGAY